VKPGRRAVFTSRLGLAGLGCGVVLGLAVLLAPGDAGWVRLGAAAATFAACGLAGALAALRRQAAEDQAAVLRLREELHLSQDHIMTTETFRSLGAYLEIAAHQMKEPLQGVVSGARALVSDRSLPEEARVRAEALLAQAEALQSSLKHLSGYALDKPGRSPFSVNTLLHESVRLVRHRTQDKNIRIEERYAVIPPVMGSAARVHQALLNIVINAIEAMPFDGGAITIETAHENDRVIARVRDTGIGIRPHELQHIFEPFFTTKPEKKGVGLGLWTAKQLLDIIGADIGVRSAPLQGTEVTVSFPQAAPLRPGREGAAHPPELAVNTASRNDRRIA
jgi:signal transduction histidine kinase